MRPQNVGVRAGALRTRRHGLALLLAYVALATTTTAVSRVLDARQKFPIGLTRTVYDRSGSTPRVISQQTATDIDSSFIDEDARLPRRFFQVTWDGVWYWPVGGTMDIAADVDDRVVIRIDDAVVLERDVRTPTAGRSARVTLARGAHRIAVVYEQDDGGYLLRLGVASPGRAPAPIDPESLFQRAPSGRIVRTNRNLSWLRRAAIAAWIAPPILALCVLLGPPAIRSIRRQTRFWWQRTVNNARLMLSGNEEGGRNTIGPVRPLLVVGTVLLPVLFVASIWRFYDPVTGFSSLVGFGEQFDGQSMPALRAVPHQVISNSGYDGQFYAQLALDPLIRSRAIRTALDSLPYRSRRILLSWTAYALGFGRPNWVVNVYAVQNVAFWVLLAWVLLRWAPPDRVRHYVAWCGCLLGYGAIMSVRFALTDLPSTTLTAVALALAERRRSRLAAGVAGLSVLTRETSVVAAVGLDWFRSRNRRGFGYALVMAALVLMPLVLWLVYTRSVMGPRAWTEGSGQFVLPFTGIAEDVRRSVRDVQRGGWSSPAVSGLVALFSTAVQAIYLAWRSEWNSAWWRVGMVYAVLFTVLPLPVLEGSPGAFVRVLLPMTLAYNLIAVRSRWFWPLFIAGNLSIVQGLQMINLLPSP